jgi:hypothetical protein
MVERVRVNRANEAALGDVASIDERPHIAVSPTVMPCATLRTIALRLAS